MQDNKDKAGRANPIAYVSKDDPPFLIMHGDQKYGAVQPERADCTNPEESGCRNNAPAGQGSRSTVPREFSSEENMKLVEEFFEKHLKKGTRASR